MNLKAATETRIIDGKATAREVRGDVSRRVEALRARGVVPGLAVVLVGEDPASQVYVRNKDRAASRAGIDARTIELSADTEQARLLDLLAELNADDSVHGVLVQMPLPDHLDAVEVVHAVDPRKDVDGLHPYNVGALWRGEDAPVPCTPAGCVVLLDRYGVEIEGSRAVIIRRSHLVGKPLAALLLARHATVTMCHSRTRDLAGLSREADIVVAAVGRPRLVERDWVKPGAAVLDVGINRGEDGRLVGDVAFDEVLGIAGAITPVPGGVGPMTIAMLLQNTARAAAKRADIAWDELEGAGAA